MSIGAGFERRSPPPAELPGSWPNFRGPQYDGINHESLRLADSWPPLGPRELWSVDLANGYSSPAIHRGCAYVLDYDRESGREILRCLSMTNGQEVWRRWHDLRLTNIHGFVHTTPAVSDRHLVIIGARHHLMCVDPGSGDLRWGLDLVREFGENIERKFSVQTPLIDGSTIVIAVGEPDCLLAGLDADTGKIVWKTPNPRRRTMSMSSVVPAIWEGRKHYLYSAEHGIVAVSAEEGNRGSLLWDLSTWDYDYASIPVPVVLEGGLIFLAAGYSRGNMLLGTTGAGGPPRILWQQECREGLSSEAHTPLVADRHLFAIQPQDAGNLKQQMVCADPYDAGKIKWTSGKKFGMNQPYLLADGKLFVASSDCCLIMIRATSKSYQELGRAKILKSGDWHPWMALAGGRLLIRESGRIACFDLRE